MFEDLIRDKENERWVCPGCGMLWDTDVKQCPVCQTEGPRWKFNLKKTEVGQKKSTNYWEKNMFEDITKNNNKDDKNEFKMINVDGVDGINNIKIPKEGIKIWGQKLMKHNEGCPVCGNDHLNQYSVIKELMNEKAKLQERVGYLDDLCNAKNNKIIGLETHLKESLDWRKFWKSEALRLQNKLEEK